LRATPFPSHCNETRGCGQHAETETRETLTRLRLDAARAHPRHLRIHFPFTQHGGGPIARARLSAPTSRRWTCDIARSKLITSGCGHVLFGENHAMSRDVVHYGYLTITTVT